MLPTSNPIIYVTGVSTFQCPQLSGQIFAVRQTSQSPCHHVDAVGRILSNWWCWCCCRWRKELFNAVISQLEDHVGRSICESRRSIYPGWNWEGRKTDIRHLCVSNCRPRRHLVVWSSEEGFTSFWVAIIRKMLKNTVLRYADPCGKLLFTCLLVYLFILIVH